MKRLDIGEGSYMKELEEDFDVQDAMHQVGTRRGGAALLRKKQSNNREAASG